MYGLLPCRDLKLDNIMLQKQQVGSTAGGRSLPTAKITDFGLHVVSHACSSTSRHAALVHEFDALM